MASSVPNAKGALRDLLQAHTFPGTQPQVTWSQPTEHEDYGSYELIYMGDSPPIAETYRVLGHTRLDEEYTIRLFVDVYKYGDDEEATERRAYQLRDHVVSVVNLNQTLSGTVNRVNGFLVTPANTPGGNTWHTRLLIEIAVVAYETL